MASGSSGLMDRGSSRDLQRTSEEPGSPKGKTPKGFTNGNNNNHQLQRTGSVESRNSHESYKEKKHSHRYLKGTAVEKPPDPDSEGLKRIMVHPLNILLAILPFGAAASYLQWGDLWVFWLNFIGLVPLAKILGDATEELAANLKNDMLAGLLNATFGNAVEVVFAVQSLRAGLIPIVKATLLGSVLSNTLLVLGCAFFFGGIITSKRMRDPSMRGSYSNLEDTMGEAVFTGMRNPDTFYQDANMDYSEKIQSFSMLGALVNTSMLLVSCLSLSLVTIFRTIVENRIEGIDDILLPASRISSCFILSAYGAFIFFQLVTHKDAMSDDAEEDQDDDHLSLLMSLALLCGSTIVVAFSSELLVDAIAGVCRDSHMSQAFIGVVLLPVVGNACEHVAAVRFAIKDKLGLSVGIAIGSSTQIALFVVPLSVLIGWALEKPMDLDFGPLNCALITLSAVVVLSMVVDGNSNWLQGYLLCTVYAIVSVLYWFLPDKLSPITADRHDQITTS